MTSSSTWSWNVDLEGMIGKFCRIENFDGIVREGRVSGVRSTPLLINGTPYKFPQCVELNGDQEDQLDFSRMKELTLK